MIIGINYANDKYFRAQKLNTWSMYHKGKADLVIEYGPQSLDAEFSKKNRNILEQSRGNGYWLWKPYLILKTLNEKVPENEYLFYCDSGAVLLEPIQLLIDAMEQAGQTIMCFDGGHTEKFWSKRDAFVLMDCDKPAYTDTAQRSGTYLLVKNSRESRELIGEWLNYAQDPRIITDSPNEMGLPNYDGFRENRHDQTVWSLLTKKHGIPAFCDPSQYWENRSCFPDDMQKRSPYPVVVYSHRRGYLKTWWQFRVYEWAAKYEIGRLAFYVIGKLYYKQPLFTSIRNRNK